MNEGQLSRYFTGVAVKTLAPVEADRFRSNQHEFNGVTALRTLLGSNRRRFRAAFVYLSDSGDEPLVEPGFLRWYDSREQKREQRSGEFRLYYPTTEVSKAAAAGDTLVIARRPDSSLLVVVAQAGSTIASQVRWLFGVSERRDTRFTLNADLSGQPLQLAARAILEAIGVEVEPDGSTDIERMVARFRGAFPTTWEFSEYARSTLPEIVPADDPDLAIVAWMDREEQLFRAFERHLIEDRIARGFRGDTDAFIKFSLSVHQRRKSRAGFALENHLEHLFGGLGLHHVRTPVTENKAKPDFLFPGLDQYRDANFSATNLTMLGAKSTCKDRWRQVLSEAKRVRTKHLLTLEPAISSNQTDEMHAHRLRLVVPAPLHNTYTAAQQNWLLDVAAFAELTRQRQERAGLAPFIPQPRKQKPKKKSSPAKRRP